MPLALLSGPSAAVAQEIPPWSAQVSVGSSDIHGSPDQGVLGGVRLGRGLGTRRLFQVDVGGAVGKADGGFGTLTLGLEGRLPGGRVSPYLRLEGGWLFEGRERYVLVGAGAGLRVRVTPRLFLRAGAFWGAHGFDEGGEGPILYEAGLELRF